MSANNAVAGSKPRGGGFGAAGGGYQNTEIGQIIVLAYLDAYKKLVTQLGGQPVTPAAAPAQLLAIPRAGPLPLADVGLRAVPVLELVSGRFAIRISVGQIHNLDEHVDETLDLNSAFASGETREGVRHSCGLGEAQVARSRGAVLQWLSSRRANAITRAGCRGCKRSGDVEIEQARQNSFHQFPAGSRQPHQLLAPLHALGTGFHQAHVR